MIRFAKGSNYLARVTSWFADPRIFILGDRAFLYFNSGWHEPMNHQFVVGLLPVLSLPPDAPGSYVYAKIVKR